ncbi:nicotinate-nucleotide--dimethylbenzimidazole phosphoribosyltransferase [Actimicrobium sp. CCC2.4]|uniref:nicotinate-nucleotide--dimethylbenzimidazole phosphoribosyltransferase n=1 Tax=Actimicrobium sp. CCC2.4 TaxID=3048606 RepID=UPI002AC9A1B9|nr:nicotinate-nucleotide--dimethylbenzimidazole phosphoribosyltransferase [Actimicrobium sp. CCC2.4]MEB0136844.1 nicotinate-nucleotide--dimethylbenzimidazole phosphoribosyltransferase [Actimicrobium sp. CCC2.4]WPX33881.1 nicotinate-nucleotide--dimethylbenzimidazole phosphoribosyltransferase [Actimicrobium sp. CCC2.4]
MSVKSIEATTDKVIEFSLNEAISHKTKPLGSLGLLETIAKQIGLVQQTIYPKIISPAILIFAADHGIVAENISAYPQSVTWQMVNNFLAGGAAINVFARQHQCDLQIIDAGINHVFADGSGLLDRKIGFATRNFARMPAMDDKECAAAMQAGAALVDGLTGNVVGFGEMGIGNTTSAAAIMHKMTGVPVADCVGAGTGLSAEGVRHKQEVIERAVALHKNTASPVDVLATFGGFEIAMMVGAMRRAAELRMVLLIDGFIVTSALLVASRLEPAILDYCIFSHCSDENGHARMLAFLDAKPLLHLGLRLGEGSGCALVLPLLHSAVNFLCDMASFDSAAVSQRSDASA